MFVLFYELRCSAVDRTVIRQESVSYGLMLIGCGKLVVFIFVRLGLGWAGSSDSVR